MSQVDDSKLKELEKLFEDFAGADDREIFMQGFRKAARPLVDAAQANVAKRSRRLQRSIGIMELTQEMGLVVGARRGLYQGHHGHLVEKGTAIRFRKSSGGSTGAMPASHFFERSYEQVKEGMFSEIGDEIEQGINKIILRRKFK